MSQPIYNNFRSSGPTIFYNENFRIVLENHLQYFRNRTTTQQLKVKPVDAHRWQGDFNGLLAYLGIDAYMHWFVGRLNGIESSDSFNTIITSIMIPDPTEIEMIRQQFLTTHPNI